MLLATSGCSHSCDRTDIKESYTKRLSSMLGYDLINISQEAKDNNQIMNDTLAYLSNPSNQKPNVLIVQWTEPFRHCLFKKDFTKDWEKNNGVYSGQHWYKINPRDRVDLKDYFKIQVIHEYKWVELEILSENNVVEKTDIIHKTYAIQQICNYLGIEVYFWNMFNMQGIEDKVWDRCDTSRFLIANVKNSRGMFNHLLWCGFEPASHQHFLDDAEEYIANCLYDFIKNGTQIYTEEVCFDRHQDQMKRIHRYEGE